MTDSPDASRPAATSSRRRRPVVMAVYAVVAVVVVGLAALHSAQSAASGSDLRSNLTLIAPADPGGGWDTFQREQQQAMRANRLVNNVQVVNIPGAAGTIALGKLTTLRGEANNLMVSGTGLVAGVAQTGSPVSHDDVTLIARVVEEYDVVVVKADSPYQTLDQLVEAWEADPDAVTWTGGGTFDQLVSTEFATKAGIPTDRLTYIPKSGGGEAAQALITDTASAATSGYMDVADQIEAGRLRALGLAAPERLSGVDIPTLTEQGYDVTLANWRAVVAPPGITPEEKAELTRLTTEAVQTPEWREAVARNKWTDVFLTGPELDRWLAGETRRIEGLVKEME